MTGEPFDVARALRWLRQLQQNNDRTWFAAHRATYDEHVKPEWEDLIAALLASAVPLDERLAYVDPRACIFRLARDIRFSSDKTPFKPRVSAWLSPLGKTGACAGYYVAVEPGRTHFSAGIYVPEKPVLEALRRTLAADARPFLRILNAKRLAPYLPLRTDALTRMPRSFPKDHPHGELIRARHYLVGRDYTNAEIARAGAYKTFAGAIHECAPLVAWLDAIATAAQDHTT
jgi:uncharacterized protein (TIGR02453 family)